MAYPPRLNFGPPPQKKCSSGKMLFHHSQERPFPFQLSLNDAGGLLTETD